MAGPHAEQLPAAPNDDDVGSDTSIEETYDEDMLWTVEGVLAELPGETGVRTKHYLVAWTGFELYDATWEPEENLEQATIQSWEDTKAAVESGAESEFDVASWFQARIDHLSIKLARARLRDAKRIATGLPPSRTADDLEEKLNDVFTEKDDYYEVEVSDDHIDDHESESDDAVLGSSNVIDLTVSSSRFQGTARPKATPRIRIDTGHPHKPTNSQSAAAAAGRHRRGAMPTGSTNTRTQPTKRPALEIAGMERRAALPKTSSIPKVLQPPKHMQPPKQTALKAKRSNTAAGAQGAGANIFTSGKVQKKRRDLSAAMNDPDANNRLFQKHRIRNIAYKKSRDKEDLPPTTITSKLFDISKGPIDPRPKKPETVNRAVADGQDRPSTLAKRRTTDEEAPSPEGGPPRPTEKKRKKSVRFCDAPVMQSPSPIQSPRSETSLQSEAMDLDEPGLFVPQGPPSPTRADPESEDIKPSLANLTIEGDSQPKGSTTIKKVVDFGSGGKNKVEVLLDGIPNAHGEPWFNDLTGTEEITFTHTCVARNLAFQIQNIAGGKIASGHIRTVTPSGALENVASRLMLGSFGTVCFRHGYLMVVCPSRCGDWKTGAFATESASPPEVDLRFMIFSRGPDGNPPPEITQVAEHPDSEPLRDRAMVWQRLLDVNYKSLLPKIWKEGREPGKGPHAFFLLFPPSRRETLHAFCSYLRSCDGECLIYTSLEPGSWEHVRKTTSYCTIIIHEAVISTLRRLRCAHAMIPASDSRVTFWRVTEAMTAYSDIPFGQSDNLTPPGKIGFHRLLPGGKATLLTPSFLLTQPRAAAQFLTWYMNCIARTRHVRTNKIVIAHGMLDYLRDIADQRWQWRTKAGTSTGDGGRPIGACGAALEDCEATETAWITLRQLVEKSRKGCGWKDEDLFPVVCAPEGYALADEQSLVNWFGWWSMMHLEDYRGFIVLGTSDADTGDETKATVETGLPTYHPDTINDLDGRISMGHAMNHAQTLPFRKIPDDSTDAITSFLDRLNQTSKQTSLAVLYKYPVGFSSNQARRASPHHPHTLPESFQSWFTYLRPFKKVSKGVLGKFVYGGLFYTAPDDINGNQLDPHASDAHPHPWLAFYRPANPHRLSRGKHDGSYELVIWDWTSGIKFPGSTQPTEEKLTAAQRQLIDFIKYNTAAKNPGSVLAAVWLGGPDPGAAPPAHPLDVTLEFLERAMDDTKIAVPATAVHMTGVGYRKVVLESQALDGGAERPGDEGPEGEVVLYDIFHPPRGDGAAWPSQCRNLLFQQASEARRGRRMGVGETFLYRFQPTTRWYDVQRNEGRGFEHMLVDRWQAGFHIMGVGKDNAESPDGS